MKIGIEDAQSSFNNLADRFKVMLEVLGALITLHEVIFSWSNETSRVTQLCENPVDTHTLDNEIEKLGMLYNEYKDRYEEYNNYPQALRDSMYSLDMEIGLKSDIMLWLDRLDKAGHVPKAGPTLLFDPQIGRDEYMMAAGQRLSGMVQRWAIRGEHTASPASGPGRAHSTPQYSGASVWFADETAQLTQVEAYGTQATDMNVSSSCGSTTNNRCYAGQVLVL